MSLENLSIADLSAAIHYMKKANEEDECFKEWREMDTGCDYNDYKKRIKYNYPKKVIEEFKIELKSRVDSIIGLKTKNKKKI